MILPKSHEDDSFEEPPAELHLHLRMPQGETDKQPPSRLARWLGLHLYSDVLLGKSARTEMNFSAVILLVVSLFELIAWSFLFNAIFRSDILYFGIWTLPAVLLASLFACAVFWFERQFLTYDEARRGNAKWAALIRFMFILFSAFITAQPLELLFFRLPIQNRVHEERIREEAVAKLSDLQEYVQRGQGYYAQQVQQEQQAYNTLVSQLQSEQKLLEDLNKGLVSSAGVQGYWGAESKWRGSSADQDAKKENERLAKAAANQAAAKSQTTEIRQQKQTIQETINSLQDQVKTKNEDIKNLVKLQQENEQRNDNRLRSWIDQLRKSKPREVVKEKWQPPASDAKSPNLSPWDGPFKPYQDEPYDVFEQIDVVWDLALGKPPSWRNGTKEIWAVLDSKYGFGNPGEIESGRKVHRLIGIAACHLIALFIPFLVLTIKLFLMPPALRKYYSSRHQAAAGEGDAWFAAIVDGKVNEEDRLAARKTLNPKEKR